MPYDAPTCAASAFELDAIRKTVSDIRSLAITAVVIPSDEHYPDSYRLGTYSYRLERIKAALPGILAEVERLEKRLAEEAVAVAVEG